MTANQIAWAKHLEDVRTHRVQEQETQRHNVQTESEQQRGNTLNYEASKYATQVAERNAILNANNQREIANYNAEVSMRNADLNAQTSAYTAQVSAAASKYASDVSRQNTLSTVHTTGAKTAEEIRHNKVTETQQWVKTGSDAVGTVWNVVKGVLGFATMA